MVDLTGVGPEGEEVEVELELEALATLEERESMTKQIQTRTRAQIPILDQELQGEVRGLKEVQKIQEEMEMETEQHGHEL